MQSVITLQFICVVFLLLVTIASLHKARVNSKREKCTRIRNKVTIEQITRPVGQGKGPYWDHRTKKLYFVDTYNQKIYRLDPATGELTHTFIANGPLGVAVPVEDEPDKFVAGVGTDFVLITWNSNKSCSDSSVQVLGSVFDKNRDGTHFNDGKVDSHGRFWAGTIGSSDASNPSGITPNQASLYRLTSDRVIKTEIATVSISYGLAWNKKDTTFYYIDTPTRKITAYNFDAHHGKISNKRIVFDLGSYNISGIPDGMTIDTNGNLWIAVYRSGLVIKVDPVHGKLLQSIEIPADKVTSVIWGGSLLDILYVTTSSLSLTSAQVAAQPNAGSVFAVKCLGARGYAGNLFSLNRKN